MNQQNEAEKVDKWVILSATSEKELKRGIRYINHFLFLERFNCCVILSYPLSKKITDKKPFYLCVVQKDRF